MNKTGRDSRRSMATDARRCCLCGADQWNLIPDPVPDQSITTAGVLLRNPLAKAQCGNCGLLQKNAEFVGNSDYYENRYADYYLRPGSETYDAPRYKGMSEWMGAALGDFRPKSILDVGCGAGWSMLATQNRFPGAVIEGIEPSKVNAERARRAGFEVSLAKIDAGARPHKIYDLVYANNVLQHVLSPVEFLTALRGYVSDDSLVVLICPDASRPSNEMLWSDHNHSFRPDDLVLLAEKTGFRVRAWLPNPDNITLLDKQLVVLSKGNGAAHASVGRPDIAMLAPQELYQQRCNYIESWREVDRSLCAKINGFSRILNFGSSSWTWLLAGYCPQYWSQVDCCVVDQFSGYCVDKVVKAFAEVAVGPDDGLVLGVNPVSQPAFAKRFEAGGQNVIRWDNLVQS